MFYEVVSVRWLIPYKYRKILEMLPNLMKLCEIMGIRHDVALTRGTVVDAVGVTGHTTFPFI